MRACIVAVGSEMLTPFRVDTNSLVITEKLNAVGCDVRQKAVVADDIRELADLLRSTLDWADLVVLTGGLGPTADDITRDAVAEVLQVPMDVDERIVDRIRERFARRGLSMPDINRRQAMVPHGATVLPNPNGSAPGLLLRSGRAMMVLLPGPPREMKPMLDDVIREYLTPLSGGARLFRRVLKITGRTESDVDAVAAPIYTKWIGQSVRIDTTILAVLGQVELHLTAHAEREGDADAALDSAIGELQAALGSALYSVDGRPLEAVIGNALREQHLTIAVAESCTGGLLASRLTDVPGSSAYVERGVVCYSNRSKVELLGVPESLIDSHGAVSEEVAVAMAQGIRDRAGSDVGIGITGIAGPDGGTPAKPVGTVCIAVIVRREGAGEPAAWVRTFPFIGGREMVKFQSAQAAMNMLRLMLIGAGGR
jgi:competence/damage-inducible protein CinA-like protein